MWENKRKVKETVRGDISASVRVYEFIMKESEVMLVMEERKYR